MNTPRPPARISGRRLFAGSLMVTIAALVRVIVPFLDGYQDLGIWLSGIAWTAAFGLFTVLYFPVFTQPKVQSRGA